MSRYNLVLMTSAVAAIVLGIAMMPASAPTSTQNNLGQSILDKFNRAYPSMASDQKANAKSLIDEATALGVTDLGQLAYILATTIGESNVRPIKEYRAAEGTALRKTQDAYWYTGYYGRGYVQLTWKDNYAKFAKYLGVDLVGNPDLALNPKYAAQIAAYGMKNGSFTGKKLSDYILGAKQDFENARRIINGTDKAATFAGYARKILSA